MTVHELIEILYRIEDKYKEVLITIDKPYEYNVAEVFDDGVNIILSHTYSNFESTKNQSNEVANNSQIISGIQRGVSEAIKPLFQNNQSQGQPRY